MGTGRLGVLGGTCALSIASVAMFHQVVNSDAVVGILEWAAMVLFAILSVVICYSFCLALLGFVSQWQQAFEERRTRRLPSREPLDASKRTAILIPIFNESPARVFAGVEAMRQSLESAGHADRFDFFVLSDTTDADHWIQEENSWFHLCGTLRQQSEGDPTASWRAGPMGRVFYRHRGENTSRKSGNIESFCRRWGSGYDYMIVLDADSLMEGETMAEMVRMMDRDLTLGILQVPTVPVGNCSLFARLQQFSSDVYGPLFSSGASRLFGDSANYFGHNAILRVDAFMKHCKLPRLSGSEPLGGEILSHDFVEAALMLRAGYGVRLAEEIGGSYEECPTTLDDFVRRDQRWCQGNLQHARLIPCAGFRMVSRFHFLSGVLSYVSSPIWLAFLFLTLCHVAFFEGGSVTMGGASVALMASVMAALMIPKFLALVLCLVRGSNPRRATVGRGRGPGYMLVSVFVESLFGVLISPILAFQHSRFVLANLRGESVRWRTQRRGDQGVSWKRGWTENSSAFCTGVILTLGVLAFAPDLILWFSPILAGLVLSVPLSLLLASSAVGKAIRRVGGLVTKAEVEVPEIVTTRDHLEKYSFGTITADPERPEQFHQALQNRRWIECHARLIAETGESVSADERARRAARSINILGLTEDILPEHQFAMLADYDLVTSVR